MDDLVKMRETIQILDTVIRLVKLILEVKENLEVLVKVLLRLNNPDGVKIRDGVTFEDKSRRSDLVPSSVTENRSVLVPRLVRENERVDENDRDREKLQDPLNISEGVIKLESSTSCVSENRKVREITLVRVIDFVSVKKADRKNERELEKRLDIGKMLDNVRSSLSIQRPVAEKTLVREKYDRVLLNLAVENKRLVEENADVLTIICDRTNKEDLVMVIDLVNNVLLKKSVRVNCAGLVFENWIVREKVRDLVKNDDRRMAPVVSKCTLSLHINVIVQFFVILILPVVDKEPVFEKRFVADTLFVL